MIHTDGHSTIVSIGTCDPCIRATEHKKVRDRIKMMDAGQLTETGCLEALSLALRSGAQLKERHQRLVEALVVGGYLDQEGHVVRPLI